MVVGVNYRLSDCTCLKFIMESASHQLRLKIIVVGDSGVGKSSLTQRYHSDNPELGRINATLGVDFCIKQIVIDNYNVKLQIWDTAGQERFRSLIESYYRNSDGVVAVYDVGRRDSFDHIEYWISKARTAMAQPVIIIVGNKIDRENREVTRSEGLQYSKRQGALFMETSVLIGQGIGHVFEKLVRKIILTGVADRQMEVQQLSLSGNTGYKSCVCGQ